MNDQMQARHETLEELKRASRLIDDYIDRDLDDVDGFHIACEAYDAAFESALRYGYMPSEIVSLQRHWRKEHP